MSWNILRIYHTVQFLREKNGYIIQLSACSSHDTISLQMNTVYVYTGTHSIIIYYSIVMVRLNNNNYSLEKFNWLFYYTLYSYCYVICTFNNICIMHVCYSAVTNKYNYINYIFLSFLYLYGSYISILQGVSSLRSLTPFTPACNTGLTKN